MTSKLLLGQRDYTPISWTEFFDEAHDICVDSRISGSIGQDSFRVYLKNFREPYAPNREPSVKIDPTKLEFSKADLSKYSRVPTLVMLHGGGYSGLTWAQFSRNIEQYCHCRILSIDLRGHGDTKTSRDDLMDIDTLVMDVSAVTHATHRICGFLDTPKIVLIGHSMGGALAVNCASRCLESFPSLAGFVVIDVVEGTAKDALPQMMSVIKTRPAKFPSLSNAIKWSIHSGMAKNLEAARVSMPGNLVNIATCRLSIHDVTVDETKADKIRLVKCIKQHKYHISADQLIGPKIPMALQTNVPLPPCITALGGPSFRAKPPIPTPIGSVIREHEQSNPLSEGGKQEIGHSSTTKIDEWSKETHEFGTSGYCWRSNLAKTEPYWSGWFEGLSQQLLTAPVQGKFLLLAGIDRLDKALTIGHMQGKFMMKVLPKCGHAVHEDAPEQVASTIGNFLLRNKFVTIVEDTSDQ